MGTWYPMQPIYPAKPLKPKQIDLLNHYNMLRMQISDLEEIIEDEKELDKAVVLLKIGCKLIKKRLRKIGFDGPFRQPKEVAVENDRANEL